MDIDPRPLTPGEAAVLEHVLSVEFEGVEALRAQAAGAVVVGTCDCPCPTISLRVPDGAPRVPQARTSSGVAPVEGDVVPVAGEQPAQVILLLDRHGRLTSMEYVWLDEPASDWPAVDRIRLTVRPPGGSTADPAGSPTP